MLTQEQQERFAELWTEAQPSVSQYIRAVRRDSEVAQDVLQATALVLLRRFDEYDPERPFVAWFDSIRICSTVSPKPGQRLLRAFPPNKMRCGSV